MGLAVGDYNDDGRLDLLKTHFADDIPALYRNLGKGLFEDVGHRRRTRRAEPIRGMGRWPSRSRQRRLARPRLRHRQRLPGDRSASSPSIRTAVRVVVFRNRGDGATFEDVIGSQRRRELATPRSSRGAAFGDIDNDGDVDVLVMNMNEPPALLRNDSADANGWIDVRLEGTRVEPRRRLAPP